MLKLILFNDSHYKEVSELFNEVKDYFPIWQTLDNALKACQGHFYTVTFNGEFTGCLFLHKWAEDSVYIGGFSKRKNPHTLKAINLLTNGTFEDYPIDKIYTQINKNNKPAQFCMKKAGFSFIEQIDDNYIFERNK